ncbi:hypothetical protein [Bacillus alkalicellulosilyticus]|uniref:hypothetical protein n=1 Tax=Alkalihalobacterium alkalicellulosilyticum TaxID=1912214 RepID=UPI000997DC44|nr:hypothetical protein [Bacillus alkalicellulosilyticus]
MFDYSLPNVGSFVLGLIAWILPIVILADSTKKNQKKWLVVLLFISFSACAIAVCFQLIYSFYLVTIEDWGALMDTAGGVAFAAAFLVIVTIVLNALALIAYRKRTTT